MAVVDYHSLPRKELQNLCKKHGIPANKTNSFMADALTSILKVDKPNEFGSATPTALSEDVGKKSIPSTLKRLNNRGDFTASKLPHGSTFCYLEIQSQRKEPIEEEPLPLTMDTNTEEFNGEKIIKTEKATIDDSDTAKISEAEKVLLHVASLGTDDQKELYHHANQQIEPGPDTRIDLHEDVLEELCQQAKFVTRKGNEYSLCCTSSSSLCKDVSDRLDHDTKIYTHDEQTTVDMQRVDHLGQDKAFARNADEESLHCTSSSSACLAVNVGDTYEDKISTDHEERPIHIEGVDLLSQEKHCEQDKAVTRNADEESLHCTSCSSPCLAVNVGDTYEDKISTDHEERQIHVEGVDLLSQDKAVTRNTDEESLHCTSSSSPCLEVNVGDTYEDKISINHEERPIHVEGVDLLSQEKEIYMKDQEETAMDPVLLSSCEKNHHDNDKEKNSQSSYIDIDDRKGLFTKEMDIDDETVKHGQPSNQSPSCRRNDEVEESMVKIQTAEVSNRSSFQFFVCCDNGIKLFVDLENSSPSEWMKTHNYEFSFCQELDEHKHCEHSQLKSANCQTIFKDDVTAENRKIRSDKLTDFQPLTSDFERISDQNPTTCFCSSKFLKSQNFGSISPIAFTKKLDVCRELRRTSSFLIPPHGSNRGLSPFMTKKSSRLSSTFMSPKNPNNNVSSSPSTIGDSHISVSTQVNCLSESSWPKKTAPLKVQNFSIKLETPEKEVSLAKYHPNTQSAYSIDEPASPHAFVDAVSVKTPIKDGCQDVEMLDQDLHYYSTESPHNKADNEHNFHLAEEDYQSSDKEVESLSQMNCPDNSQKQMHKKSLLQDLQVEENRIISRNKDDYKKSPFTKCLRHMKNLARAATIRADILARRRGLPLVGNNSAYSQSISALHNLPFQSQNVQRKSNENGVSPQVYCETDLCVSSIKRYEREDPVIFPSVYRDTNLSVSHLTPGKDPVHNVCNNFMPLPKNGPVITSASAGLARDEACQSNTIIRESNPKLSERDYSEISSLVHQQKPISVYGLIPRKELLQNIGNISAPLALVGPVTTQISTGIDREEERQNSATTSEYNPKLFGRSFQPLAKKRFFEKALAESTERMQAQRTQLNAVNDLSGQNNFAEKVPSNKNNTDYLLNSNLTKFEDGPNEKVSENQTRHQENLKTTLRGKSKEKAMEVAKKKAFVQWNDNEMRNNTGNLLDLNWIKSYMLETEDGHNKRVSGRQRRHQEQFKISLRGNSKEKAMKVAKQMAFVQRNEVLNLKRGITTVN